MGTLLHRKTPSLGWIPNEEDEGLSSSVQTNEFDSKAKQSRRKKNKKLMLHGNYCR